jgi:ATP-dependent DNA helicase HFM1/MER3
MQLNVGLVTGDVDVDHNQLVQYELIVTTPEKWDSLSRRWASNPHFLNSIALCCIDEIHLLNEERGAVLEGLITRLKMAQLKEAKPRPQNCSPIASLRFVALSATIPNAKDIARWLNNAECLEFDSSYRPVPLTVYVEGFRTSGSTGNCNQFFFDKNLNNKILPFIEHYSKNRPCLIFCNSRKSTEQAAKAVLTQILQERKQQLLLIKDDQQRTRLASAAQKIKDKHLAELIREGVGFHSAGVEYSDRHEVETLFSLGYLYLLFTTSTLAQGVNLPAFCVIIKSTQCYRHGVGYVEMTATDIMQMIGKRILPCTKIHRCSVS